MEIEKGFETLDEMKRRCISSQQRGLHFIIASVLMWGMVFGLQYLEVSVKQKNLISFCCFALLLPTAFVISKFLKIDFQSKENPLTVLGIIFTVNQILYLLIAIWAFTAVPEKMLMIVAIIFGGHLLPYSWLYKSKVYLTFAILIPITSLIVGMIFSVKLLTIIMIMIELIFCVFLIKENAEYFDKVSYEDE